MNPTLRSIFRFSPLLLLLAVACVPASAGTVGAMFVFTPFGSQELILTTSSGTVTLGATSMGWWDSTGGHSAANTNYGVGDGNSTPDHHDFFVFDLRNVSANILNAQLSIGNPAGGFVDGSPAGNSTLSIWDVSTSIATLTADGAGQIGIFNDLGSGVLYASRGVSAADNSSQVLINLNGSALTALNAGKGGQFAFGGSLSVAPEPATFLLFGSALLAIGVVRRRNRPAA